MQSREPISIIVLYHSGESYLKACLNSIVRTVRETDEILVIVNNENQTELTRKIFDNRISYYSFDKSLGHGKAANKGVELAKNEHIVIADHDLVFEQGWLDSLWRYYKNDKSLGGVCCKIINTLNNSVLDCGISFSGYNFSHPFMDLDAKHPLTCVDRNMQMICTGGFLTKKTYLKIVGGFNENFGTLYTDLDLSLKLKKFGFKVGVSASAIAYHFSGEFQQADKKYKSSFLKSDVKGVFMKENANTLEIDLQNYYQLSAEYFLQKNKKFRKYFICNLMNVVNPNWYENVMCKLGMTHFERLERATGLRDSENIRLFESLGYDIMKLGVPIAYFVDRFCSLKKNAYWWDERRISSDIIIDRNANIVLVKDI